MPAGMIGRKVGSYRIVESLGSGGMGELYVAEHLLVGKRAAVKVLKPEVSMRKEAVSRFFNEAKSAARVRHPGIVDVYDFGRDEEGGAYLIMELLDGCTLKAMLSERGPQSTEKIARVGWEIADVLSAAHAQSIVHRDLKPSNVFLVRDPAATDGERVKVLDFGVAKLTAPLLAAGVETSSDALIGTPLYMAPEQARGAGDVDARADIYALGCILFEMACGRPPFDERGTGEILGAHLHVPAPRISELGAVVDPALETLVVRMLSKDPEDRPGSMRSVADVLGTFCGRDPALAWSATSEATVQEVSSPPALLETTVSAARSETRADRARLAVVRLIAVLIVVGALGGGWLVLRGRTPPADEDASAAVGHKLPLAPLDTAPVQLLQTVDAAPVDVIPSNSATPAGP